MLKRIVLSCLVCNNDLVVNLLAECMNDTDKWIAWFICELNYGREKPRIKWYGNGTEDIFNDAHELYTFLLEEYHE